MRRAFHQCAHQIVGLFLKDGIRANIKKRKDNDEAGASVTKLLALCWLGTLKNIPLNSKHAHYLSKGLFHSDPDKQKAQLHSHTFILLPAVVGRPFLSALRFSGNSALMKLLLEDRKWEIRSKKEKKKALIILISTKTNSFRAKNHTKASRQWKKQNKQKT